MFPALPAVALAAALGFCFAYGSVLAGHPELVQLRTVRELRWALLILGFGLPAQRRRLRTVLLSRQAEAARQALRGRVPAPPKQLLRPSPELCGSCRAKIGARQLPLRSQQELDEARARARNDYRVSRREVDASWRRAELSPSGQFLLGMIGKEELRAQYPPLDGIGLQLCDGEEPGGD